MLPQKPRSVYDIKRQRWYKDEVMYCITKLEAKHMLICFHHHFGGLASWQLSGQPDRAMDVIPGLLLTMEKGGSG